MPPEVFPLEEARVAHGYVGVVDGLGAVSVEVLGEQKYEKKNVDSSSWGGYISTTNQHYTDRLLYFWQVKFAHYPDRLQKWHYPDRLYHHPTDRLLKSTTWTRSMGKGWDHT